MSKIYSYKRQAIVFLIITLPISALVYMGTYMMQSVKFDSKIVTVNSDNTVNLLNQGWDYLPGSSYSKSSLNVMNRGFKIVEQDGSGGQPNPPVNVFGTHLNVDKNFVIVSSIKNLVGSASMQFYDSPPIVSDEFRVEPPSVRLSVNGNQLTVSVWNGKTIQNLSNQLPIYVRTSTFNETGSSDQIKLMVINGQLIYSVNSEQLGTIPVKQIIKSGHIWIGFNADDSKGSFLVTSLTASSAVGGKAKAINTSTLPPVTKNSIGLQLLANKKRPGFLIGTDAALWATSNSSYSNTIYGGDFGIITPENAMKWQFTEPQPDVFDYHEADALVKQAHINNMQVWGHTLVFSEALPMWVQVLPTSTPSQKTYVEQVMINHITNLVTHFKGHVSGWDVVDEPIKDYDNNGNFDTSQPLRENVFYRAMGPKYISIALKTAHKADPNAELAINDFGFDGLQNDSNDDRANAIFNLLKKLKSDNAPINIYGFESHIYDPSTDMIVDNNGNAPILKQHIKMLANIGLKSRISELDAPLSYSTYGSSSQEKQFVGTLNTCINVPSCEAFSFWSLGITDVSQDSNNGSYALQNGNVDSVYDQNMNPINSYFALRLALQ